MALTLTPIGSDNFTRANSNSLGANWTKDTGGDPSLTIHGNVCEPSASLFGLNYWSANATPNDQYGQVTIGADSTANSAVSLIIRATTDIQNGYELDILGPTGTGTAEVVVSSFVSGTQTNVFYDNAASTVAPGDVFVLAIVGADLYLLQNGVPIFTVNDTTFASGVVFLYLTADTVRTTATATGFVMGSASGSITTTYGADSNPAGGGFLVNPVTVTVFTPGQVGATVFYTTDGTTPTHSGGTPTGTTSIYTSPLSISWGTTLTTLAYISGQIDSITDAQTYVQGYTISGSLGAGGAFATISVVENLVSGDLAGLWPEGAPAVTADGSGHFTTNALAPNDAVNTNYVVVPILFGAEFSPFNQSVIITNANITGVNWSGPAAYYALVSDFSDTCVRTPDQNPAAGGNGNPSGWTTYLTDQDLQIASNALQATAVGGVCGAHPTGYAPQADCYIQGTLVSAYFGDIFSFDLRQATTPGSVGFDCEISTTLGMTGTTTYQLLDDVVNNPLATGYGFIEGTNNRNFNAGDRLIVLARGQNMYLFWLPVGTNQWIGLLAGTSANSPSAGLSGLEMSLSQLPENETSFSNIIGGYVMSSSGPGGGGGNWLDVHVRSSMRGLRK